ncbi:MAG: hypothetical protein PHW02_04140 [bacterium]|nr:hypothetical protein [bacterium]
MLEDNDYYRACGEYKRYKFEEGITDTAGYLISTASMYALGHYNEISLSILDKVFSYESSERQLRDEALVRSYIAFSEGSFSEAIFEYEDFAVEEENLLSSLMLIRSLVLKDGEFPFDFLPDSIKKSISLYNRIDIKNPLLAYSLSAVPGLGEIYAGDYIAALRDGLITGAVTALGIMALLKNKDDFSFDKIEFTSSYLKTRDYVLAYVIYTSLIVRFQNGSKVNAEAAAEKHNNEIYAKYLTPLHSYIDSIYRDRIIQIIK